MRLGSATPRWLFSFENSRYPASKIRSRLPVECRWFTALWNSAGRSEPLQKSRCRSEEHTSELQSPDHFVCRPLLQKNNTTSTYLRNLPVTACTMIFPYAHIASVPFNHNGSY